MHINYENITNSELDSLVVNLSDYLGEYEDSFRTQTQNNSELSEYYISGLLKTEHGKCNIERSHEELDMDGDGYQQLQNFITDSPWDGAKLISAVARKTSDLYSLQPGYDESNVGYVFDETAHIKKGKESVGVARQYAGTIGKVENCQVGVHASLVFKSHTTLVNCKLFLSECWVKDDKRCQKAGIPEEERTHKSKPQLALEMLKADIEAGVRFGWVAIVSTVMDTNSVMASMIWDCLSCSISITISWSSNWNPGFSVVPTKQCRLSKSVS